MQIWYQFLIGKVQRDPELIDIAEYLLYQFLIGKVQQLYFVAFDKISLIIQFLKDQN